jgi:hypothetical protein
MTPSRSAPSSGSARPKGRSRSAHARDQAPQRSFTVGSTLGTGRRKRVPHGRPQARERSPDGSLAAGSRSGALAKGIPRVRLHPLDPTPEPASQGVSHPSCSVEAPPERSSPGIPAGAPARCLPGLWDEHTVAGPLGAMRIKSDSNLLWRRAASRRRRPAIRTTRRSTARSYRARRCRSLPAKMSFSSTACSRSNSRACSLPSSTTPERAAILQCKTVRAGAPTVTTYVHLVICRPCMRALNARDARRRK